MRIGDQGAPGFLTVSSAEFEHDWIVHDSSQFPSPPTFLSSALTMTMDAEEEAYFASSVAWSLNFHIKALALLQYVAARVHKDRVFAVPLRVQAPSVGRVEVERVYQSPSS